MKCIFLLASLTKLKLNVVTRLYISFLITNKLMQQINSLKQKVYLQDVSQLLMSASLPELLLFRLCSKAERSALAITAHLQQLWHVISNNVHVSAHCPQLGIHLVPWTAMTLLAWTNNCEACLEISALSLPGFTDWSTVNKTTLHIHLWYNTSMFACAQTNYKLL